MAVPTITLDEIADLPRGARLMGLDLGTKTIGLAISDVDRRIASPLETIRRTKFTADAEALLKLATKHGVAVLVLGLPLNMDGSDTDLTPEARRFSRQLAARFGLPVALADERLSSREARTRGGPRRNPSDGVYDALAAQVILETWFGEHA